MSDKIFVGIILAVTLSVCAYLVTDLVRGQEVGLGATVRWNTTNMQFSPHPLPMSISIEDKTFVVVMEDGSIFRQTEIYPRMDKAEWQDALWWVCDGTSIIWGPNEADMTPVASSDLQAWSICLSK